MEKIDIVIYIIKIFYTLLCSDFLYLKIVNQKYNYDRKYNFIKYFLYVLASIICLYIRINFGKSILSNLFIFIILWISTIIKDKKNIGTIMLSTIISLAIFYISYAISVVFSFGINEFLSIKNKIIYFIVIIIIQQFLINILFKLKRFKNGFQFISRNLFTNSLLICISSIIIYMYSFISYYINLTQNDDITFNGITTIKFFYFSLLFFGIIMIIIIRESLTLTYKQKLLEKTIEDYENQIKEKDEKINNMNLEIQKISDLNHKFHNRQEALRYKIDLALNNTNIEAGEEMHLEERIKDLTDEYSNELQKIRTHSILPKTKIEELDDIFTYMKNECDKNGIEFILQINGNINYLVNNIIDEIKLKTLVGDHIRDAIIAVNSCENKYKSILIALGINDTNYEFCVYDSGIEFEIDILNKLGIEKVTTHKENGGTGTGFKTTFDTLKEVKASFILEEFNKPTDNNYTKAVKFVFDGKSEQIIKSYRENILKNELNKRYIIEKI